jgi:phage antirepressor YoqD-like protein
MTRHIRGIKISEAAAQLRIGSRALLQHLRMCRVFNGKLPRAEYLDAGYFRLEHRQYTLPGTRVKKYYTITLVTPEGLAFIQEMVSTHNADRVVH